MEEINSIGMGLRSRKNEDFRSTDSHCLQVPNLAKFAYIFMCLLKSTQILFDSQFSKYILASVLCKHEEC